MPNPNITVSDTGVRISVGGLQTLSPSPAGTYSPAQITVDSFGRVIAAQTVPGLATEATVQAILNDMDFVAWQLDGGGCNGGIAYFV